MKKLLLALILIIGTFVTNEVKAQKRFVYEVDTALQTTQGFELPKSVIMVDQQYIKGNPPKLGFDLSAYSDTLMYKAGYKPLVVKSAKTDKPFVGYNLTPLDSAQLSKFCLPTGGFISVYKSIIANELEISEDKIKVYECSEPSPDND